MYIWRAARCWRDRGNGLAGREFAAPPPDIQNEFERTLVAAEVFQEKVNAIAKLTKENAVLDTARPNI